MERFCFPSKALIILSISLILSCGFINESAQDLSSRAPRILVAPPVIASLDISNNTLSLQGNALSTVTSIQLTGPGVNTAFTNSSVSETSLSALALSATNITVGALYSLVITNAYGASTFPITFTLPSPLSISGSNVGIGTASPTAPLDVGGFGANPNAYPMSAAFATNVDNTTEMLIRNSSHGTSSRSEINLFDDFNGAQLKLEMAGTGNTNTSTLGLPRNSFTGLIAGGNARDLLIANSNSANLILGTNNLERMRIDGSGNVGIGTITPGQKLDVNGNVTSLTYFVGSSTYLSSNAVVLMNNGAGGNVLVNQGTMAGTYGAITGSGSTDGYLNIRSTSGVGATDYIKMSVGNVGATEAMRIDHSGNVNIGTTSSLGGEVFTVVGNNGNDLARLQNTNAGGATNFIYYDNAGNYRGMVGYGNAGHLYSNKMFLASGVGRDISLVTDDDFSGGYAERIRIKATTGNVGIGVPGPTFQLQLSTDSAAKPGTNTWTIASDERLKNIRAPFTRGLAAINQIHPIYFRYKDGNALNLPTNTEYVGIIAQEAEKAVPEAVSKDDKGFLHMNTDAIFWAMVNSIKELYASLMSHDDRIQVLEAENLAKDQKIQELEQRLEKLEKRF